MRVLLLILGVFLTSLFANEAAHVSIAKTDFIPRVVNFIIFVGILWYLLADKIKVFYSSRSKNIADSFAKVEEKLRESKQEKELLKTKVEEAHKRAEEIIQTAKKEAELIKARIIENAKAEIDIMNKQFEEYKLYEESKMKKEVVAEYLSNLTKDIHLSSEEVANIVTKKVG
jgi:F-type H+-transporting ATPase subunit b